MQTGNHWLGAVVSLHDKRFRHSESVTARCCTVILATLWSLKYNNTLHQERMHVTTLKDNSWHRPRITTTSLELTAGPIIITIILEIIQGCLVRLHLALQFFPAVHAPLHPSFLHLLHHLVKILAAAATNSPWTLCLPASGNRGYRNPTRFSELAAEPVRKALSVDGPLCRERNREYRTGNEKLGHSLGGLVMTTIRN